MIEPHGGKLVNKKLPERKKQRILKQIDEFEKIKIDSETWKIIKNITFGVFSRLEGFIVQGFKKLSILYYVCFLDKGK